MTIKELKILIDLLPDEMEAMIEIDAGVSISACFEGCEIVEIDVTTGDGEFEKESVFILRPCVCEIETDLNSNDVNINLN